MGEQQSRVKLQSTPQPTGQPQRRRLLAAEILVVEQLTWLDHLPTHGAWFTAAPPRFTGFGTFPVRGFATIPD